MTRAVDVLLWLVILAAVVLDGCICWTWIDRQINGDHRPAVLRGSKGVTH